MSTEREALIEAAVRAIANADLQVVDDMDPFTLMFMYRAKAEAALYVFEKAQAPTDEEREALSNFLFSVYEHGSQPNALREADAILSFLASIRPAQGEPTDAQVHSAAVAIDPAAWEPGIFYWEASGARDNSLELARAALKAAFTDGQEEQS